MVKAVHHFTINVREREASLRFYGEFLGLERLPDIDMGDHRLLYFALPGGARLELIEYREPGAAAGELSTAPGQFRHLALVVDNVCAAAKQIAEFGGCVLQPPRYVEQLGFTGLLAEDPNGCELELIDFMQGEGLN